MVSTSFCDTPFLPQFLMADSRRTRTEKGSLAVRVTRKTTNGQSTVEGQIMMVRNKQHKTHSALLLYSKFIVDQTQPSETDWSGPR
jgi:hypothetical protein